MHEPARLISSVTARAVLLVLLATPLSSAAAAPQGSRTATGYRDSLSRSAAASMRDKVAAIERLGRPSPDGRGGAQGQRHKTTVTESEVNSFLAYDPTANVPVGIAQPRISILGDRRLSGTALVDLDAVRAQHRSTGWLDPLNYLSGRLPVAVAGRLSSGGGIGWFELESATISGVPIPKTLLQELLAFYSRTPANPRGLNLDDPFPLPAAIRQIDIARGEAVVVQ